MAKVTSIHLDTEPNSQPQGTARHIRNMINSKSYSNLVNEPGFSFLREFTKKINGIISLSDDKALLFFVPDEIGLYDFKTEAYTQIYVNSDFNFNINHPITGEYHKNFKEEYIVFFTDNFNPPKIINIERLLATPIPVKGTLFFPEVKDFDYGLIETSLLDSGGELGVGAYYFAMQYINQAGVYSNWSYLTNPVYIVDESFSAPLEQIDGAQGDTISAKSINLEVNTNGTGTGGSGVFPKIRIAVVQKVNGVVSSKVIFTGANLNVQTVIYDGTGTNFETITLEEIIVKNPYYKKIKTQTQLNNILYLGNLSSVDNFNYQAIANDVRINYTKKLVIIDKKEPTFGGANDASTKISQKRTFLPGEVYAFYLHFILNNGSITGGYNIPGREAVSSDLNIIADLSQTGLTGTYKKFQLRDTVDETASGATTNMGYWENGTETYPTTIDPISGNPLYPIGKVRHHKFPTSNYLRQHTYGENMNENSFYGINALHILGIKADNIVIPDDIKKEVSGWFISYAKRDVSTQLFCGQSLLQSGAQAGEVRGSVDYPNGRVPHPDISNNNEYFTNAGSWSVDAIEVGNVGGLLAGKGQRYKYSTMHTFETETFKPSINPLFIRNEYVLSTKIKDIVANKSIGTNKKEIYGVLADYTIQKPYTKSYATPAGAFNPAINPNFRVSSLAPTVGLDDRIKAIPYSQYIPANSIINIGNDRFYNEGSESSFLVELGGPTLSYEYGDAVGNSRYASVIGKKYKLPTLFVDAQKGFYGGAHGSDQGFSGGGGAPSDGITPVTIEETYLSTLYQLPLNAYTSFYDQQLARATKAFASDRNNTNQEEFYMGDGFLCDYSYVSTAFSTTSLAQSKLGGPMHGSIHSIHRFFCYANANANYRNEGKFGPYSAYYAKSGVGFIYEILNDGVFSNYQDINLWEYNKDYTSLADLDGLFSANPFDEFTNKFPYRIIRGFRANEESVSLKGWSLFRPENVYEMPRNRGEIINLQSYEDLLFIHHKYALFKTRGNTKLQSSTGELVLAQNNIFAINPIEVICSDFGSLGNQNQFSSILTKYGYCFCDAEKGELFVVSDDVKGIHSQGLTNFFKDNIIPNAAFFAEDNPFNLQGITMAYDDRFDRLIVCFQSSGQNNRGEDNLTTASDNITLSYSFLDNKWTSFHDYYPYFLFNTRNNIYSINYKSLYRHNNLLKRGKYYDQTVTFPSFVVYIKSDGKEDPKLFQDIVFSTIVRNPVNGDNYKDKTMSRIVVANSYQISGEIPFKVFGGSLIDGYNLRKIKSKWRFNKYRDLGNGNIVTRFFDRFYNNIFLGAIDTNKPFYNKIKFSDSYLLVKLQYDNADVDINNTNLEIILQDIDCDAIPIQR